MSEVLKNNLLLIAEYNEDLAERIINHKEISKPIQLIDSESGDTNLVYGDDYIHDHSDPVYEAIEVHQQAALGKNNGEKRVHILYGLGLGYVLKRFAAKTDEKIVVVEPNLDLLRVVLELVDFTEELSKPNIRLAGNIKEMRKSMGNLAVNMSDTLSLSTTPFYYKTYTNEINSINAGIKNLKNTAKLIDKPCKINIGPGLWKREGWHTLDCYVKADIQVDLRKHTPFPIVDNVVEKVFSSHCIEHIEDSHIEFMLKELYRTMKPGGVLRLSCPDADSALEAYKNENRDWFKGICTRKNDPIGALLLNTFVSYEAGSGGPQVPENVIRENFNSMEKDEFIKWCLSHVDRSRPYIAHINGIYYEKLEKMLKNAGFVDIKRCSFRNSRDEELKDPAFDMYENVSLFVECVKPSM